MFFGYPGRAIPKQWQIHAAESTGEAFKTVWALRQEDKRPV